MAFDRLTYAIIGQLARDAARRRNQIAVELDISESNLSKRISSLVAEKVIKRFTVELDLSKLGISFHAVSLITLEQQTESKTKQVFDTLEGIRSATEFASLYGQYDFFVRWMCRDNEHLDTEIRQLVAIDGLKIETHAFGHRSYRQANIFSAVIEKK